jgi:hypothetical protein
LNNDSIFTYPRPEDNRSSPYWVENYEKGTFATYLQSSGYRTVYYG